jgi:hypothetical protein
MPAAVVAGVLRRHPVISTILIVCTVAGTVLGEIYFPAEWSHLRRLAAGALSGGGVAFLITAPKMLG